MLIQLFIKKIIIKNILFTQKIAKKYYLSLLQPQYHTSEH